MRKLCPLLLLVVALVACSADSGNRVEMNGHRFEPSSLTVSVGDTVVWANATDEAHTVTADEASIPAGADYFSSGNASSEEHALLTDEIISPDDAFEWTFEEPGTYRYYCIPHRGDGMEGTIVVEE